MRCFMDHQYFKKPCAKKEAQHMINTCLENVNFIKQSDKYDQQMLHTF